MYRYFFKRLLDVVFCLIALPFFLAIFLFLAPAIWLTDRGPIFYNAPRLGKKGKIFKMFKFRSMRVNSPDLRNADGSTYNGTDDPRVTKIGAFMRKTSLDETPQIINVLLGDMSLIGPRAFIVTNYKGYETLDERRRRRLDVLPGITGYSQAYFRNSISTEQKIDCDVYYAEHLTFALDVKIFFKTIFTVLKRDNVFVSSNPELNAPKEEDDKTANFNDRSSGRS